MSVDDDATRREEQERERVLALRRPAGPRPTGWCLWCEDFVVEGVRWCDAECRDQWEAYRGTR